MLKGWVGALFLGGVGGVGVLIIGDGGGGEWIICPAEKKNHQILDLQRLTSL